MNSATRNNASPLHVDGWTAVLSRMPGTDGRFLALSGSTMNDAFGNLPFKCLKPTDLKYKESTNHEHVKLHAFSPDGTLLAVLSGSHPMLRVFDMESSRPILILPMNPLPVVLVMAFSPDNSVFVVFGDQATLIHRFTRIGNSGQWDVMRIRCIVRKHSTTFALQRRAVGVCFTADKKRVVFQEIFDDLHNGRPVGIQVKYEEVDFSLPRSFVNDELGISRSTVQWKQTDKDVNDGYESSQFSEVDFCFTADPARTYIPPLCASKSFGVILTPEQNRALQISRENGNGTLVQAKTSPCGSFFLELRKSLRSLFVIRKINMETLKLMSESKLPPLPVEKAMVVDFLVNGNIAVVVFTERVDRRSTSYANSLQDSFSTFTPHGWAVYDIRHSASFYTVMKQLTKTEYQAEKNSITLSYDGQHIGFIPVRPEKTSNCELQIFNVSNGRLSQIRKIPACCSFPNSWHYAVAPERCSCFHAIGAGVDPSVSTISKVCGNMSIVRSTRKSTDASSQSSEQSRR
eukprot:TRINITY_DN96_c0_g2_i1.p1 TRINITY_DN96_c0_g2~~TRINITY_DN96_c0_g2_i1.p1  ORF type:complete len:517 (+),score=66.11 TRINITY_DN96_c0_g2_i1:831-2381(+)